MVLSHSHTTYTQSVDGTFMQSNTYKSGAGGAVLRGDGQTLYVLGNKGLAVFDCRNPAAPQRLGVYDTGAVSGSSGAALAFHNDGVTMYIAGGKGLSVFDVSGDRRFPRKVGSTLETGALSGNGGAALAFDGDGRLYVAGGKGLVVYDVNDQRAPRKVLIPPRITGVIDTGAIASECQCALCFSHPGTAPRALYVAGGKGLAVFDLANPDLPRKVGKTVDTGVLNYNGGAALALHPHVAQLFVAGGSGLAQLDISYPFAPSVSMKFEHTGCLSYEGGVSLAVRRRVRGADRGGAAAAPTGRGHGPSQRRGGCGAERRAWRRRALERLVAPDGDRGRGGERERTAAAGAGERGLRRALPRPPRAHPFVRVLDARGRACGAR